MRKKIPVLVAAWLGVFLTASATFGAPSKWTRVSTPRLTIYTEFSPEEVKNWAVSLEAFRESLRALAVTDDRMLDPLLVVVFRNEKNFSQLVDKVPITQRSHSVSLTHSLNRDGRQLTALNAEDREMARKGLFLQGGFWLTGSYRSPLPLWLAMGLQELYSVNSIHGNRMTIGFAIDGSAQFMKQGLFVPFDQMLGMTGESPIYRADYAKFNAQAWAFVHYMVLGDDGAHRPDLARYMEALQAGEKDERALKYLAPAGLADLGKRFTRYIESNHYHSRVLPVDLAVIADQVAVAPATEAEVQVAFGYLALHFRGLAVAAPFFQRAEKLAPHSMDTLEGLGELANVRDDPFERERNYREAIALGSKFYVARYHVLYPRASPLLGTDAAENVVEPVSAREVADEAKKILRSRPGYYEGYILLSGLIGSLSEVNADDRELLVEGMRFYPDDARIEIGVAAFDLTAGSLGEAKRRLDWIRTGGLKNSNIVSGYANKLRARLDSTNNFLWLAEYYEKHDYPNAQRVADKMNPPRLLPKERARFQELRTALSAHELLEMVREAVARGDRAAAESILLQVEGMKIPPEISSEAAAVRVSLQEAIEKKALPVADK